MAKQVEAFPETMGILSDWAAEDGADVCEGDLIGHVECMKVQYQVHAPATGILRYKRNLGEMVNHDEPVAVIEVSDA